VELGAGDGFKTKIMLRHLMEQKIEFTYVPVDISAHVLKELSDALEAELPGIKVESIAATYQQALENRAWNRN
jgi:L-histidine Nalpha-methyltransferase